MYLQDELERRREECIQLRTILANASLDEQPLSLHWGLPLPEASELFTAYKTQKNVISQLQEQLAEEKGRARETEAELKAEACLQHENTRLTGENFDLREKIENLGDTIKRLKRQLKAYMKRLNEAGGESRHTCSS